MLTTVEVQELGAKYAEMLAMRLAHASGTEDDAEVRVRMSALAARFPGALREIDDLELEEIRGRIAQLEDVVSGAVGTEPWMEATALFHRLARGALHAKRWLGGRKRVDPHIEQTYRIYAAALASPEDALAWAAELAAVASPPGGRLTALVYARVGRVLGTSESHVRHLVFGASRRARLRREPAVEG